MLSDFANCLNELDKIMYGDVDVGYVVRGLENIREYIELYYEQEGKVYVFDLINYLLGHIKIDDIKNNDLNNYKILRLLLLKCHWKHFHIKTREHDCGENEEDEDNVKDNENVINIKNMNTIPENEQLCAYKEGMKTILGIARDHYEGTCPHLEKVIGDCSE